MARPAKQGLDYFPLDVHIDDKLKFIKAKFGWEGYGIIIGLFQHIYSYGYWCSWSGDDDFLYAAENRIERSLLIDIINESLRRDLFSTELYEKYQILTSTGIQKRYAEVIKRRKKIDIVSKYVLIGHALCKHDANMMQAENAHDVSKSTQREREIESKEKEKYLEDSDPSRIANFLFHNILKHKPDFLKPNIQKWSDDADKMLRIDKRDLETVKKLIAWCQADDFEKSNVLSIAKLRKRFDTLEIKMETDGKKKPVKKYKDGERSLAELQAAAIYHEDGTITLRD